MLLARKRERWRSSLSPGGTFGPRQQRNLQLVMDHSGHLTIWIDGMPRTATANTVGVLFPGHEERFASQV